MIQQVDGISNINTPVAICIATGRSVFTIWRGEGVNRDTRKEYYSDERQQHEAGREPTPVASTDYLAMQSSSSQEHHIKQSL